MCRIPAMFLYNSLILSPFYVGFLRMLLTYRYSLFVVFEVLCKVFVKIKRIHIYVHLILFCFRYYFVLSNECLILTVCYLLWFQLLISFTFRNFWSFFSAMDCCGLGKKECGLKQKSYMYFVFVICYESSF